MNRSIKLRAIGVHQPGCEGVLPSGVPRAMIDAMLMVGCDGGVRTFVLCVVVVSVSLMQSIGVMVGVVMWNVVMVLNVV